MTEKFGLYSLGPGLSTPRPVKAAHYMRLGSEIVQLRIYIYMYILLFTWNCWATRTWNNNRNFILSLG